MRYTNLDDSYKANSIIRNKLCFHRHMDRFIIVLFRGKSIYNPAITNHRIQALSYTWCSWHFHMGVGVLGVVRHILLVNVSLGHVSSPWLKEKSQVTIKPPLLYD